MSKHVLRIIVTWEFDHSNASMAAAMGADMEAAHALVRREFINTITGKQDGASRMIENIIFNSDASLQTRILAVYIAGSLSKSDIKVISITGEDGKKYE